METLSVQTCIKIHNMQNYPKRPKHVQRREQISI